MHIKAKRLEAGESKWFIQKEKAWQIRWQVLPVNSSLTGLNHQTWGQEALQIPPSWASPARTRGPAGAGAVVHGWQRSKLGLLGLAEAPLRKQSTPGHTVPNLSLFYVFSLFVFLVLLPVAQTVCTVKQQLPAAAPRLTSYRQGCWVRASEGVRLGETSATSSWLPSRAFQLFLYVLLVLCLLGI